MKIRYCRRMAVLVANLLLVFACSFAVAQSRYRNVVNRPFRTVSSGPQSALIVDVKDPTDKAAVRTTVEKQLQARYAGSALQRELDSLHKNRVIKPGQSLGLSDTVIVRHDGRLMLPQSKRTRGGGNELTFTIPVGTGTEDWTQGEKDYLQNLVTTLYAELRDNIYGAPSWNGNVTIRRNDPRKGKVDEIIGSLLFVNGDTVEIWFPTYSDISSGITNKTASFLAMAQVMAQAFHGPHRISYDAWEQGMARAAAIVAASNLQASLQAVGIRVDPANGFYYTPYYDLLNQPALGNNTFTPPTKSNQPGPSITPTEFGGMLLPRLLMSATAWLKCYIENPDGAGKDGFFKTFNQRYYTAAGQVGNHPENDVNQLRQFALAGLPVGIEGLDFDSWFERQYVLDTSVTPGPKLYVYSFPTFPDSSNAQNPIPAGAGFWMIYYQTVLTTDGRGDELDRDGTANVVYWNNTFLNRLTLTGDTDHPAITKGFGTVSPYFSGLGGASPNQNQMRITVDFPVNKEYARIPFPAGETGTLDAENNLAGVTVGSDAGSLTFTFLDRGGSVTTPVVQGAFGVRDIASVPDGLTRTRIVYTPTGGTAITYQRNLFYRKQGTSADALQAISPIFVLTAPNPTDTVEMSHTFTPGAQMISLPVKPFTGDLAKLLGMDPTQALLAQFRQDLTTDDKYVRYPSLPRYQPGYAVWANIPTTLNATHVRGESTDIQAEISVALQFGWNQIGTPYIVNLSDVANNLTIQYLNGDAVTLTDAVTKGLVAAGIQAFSQSGGYQDIVQTSTPTNPLRTLVAWQGYWILVLKEEGVTLTYHNPNSRAAPLGGRAAVTRASRSPKTDGWRLPLTLRDANGNTTSALIGQASQASDGFDSALDVAGAPPFSRAATLGIRFPHTEMGGQGFLADVRRSASVSQWEVALNMPEPEKDYTLTWDGIATLPRGTRLTLTDPTNGTRLLMHRNSSYTFHTGKGEQTRRLQIVAEPHGLGRLFIRNVVASTPPSLGGRAATTMTLSYELSTIAETQVEIRLGNRILRHIAASGRAATAGVNQMVWDMKDDQGRALPTGAYTLNITARTSDGELSRTIAPLLITR